MGGYVQHESEGVLSAANVLEGLHTTLTGMVTEMQNLLSEAHRAIGDDSGGQQMRAEYCSTLQTASQKMHGHCQDVATMQDGVEQATTLLKHTEHENRNSFSRNA